jgi:hypothetical protein
MRPGNQRAGVVESHDHLVIRAEANRGLALGRVDGEVCAWIIHQDIGGRHETVLQ